MIHVYVVVAAPNIEEAIAKGRTDYSEPQNNRSIRYSIDRSKVILEGMFTNEEDAWFRVNAVVVGSAEDVRAYIAANRAEWETEFVE